MRVLTNRPLMKKQFDARTRLERVSSFVVLAVFSTFLTIVGLYVFAEIAAAYAGRRIIDHARALGVIIPVSALLGSGLAAREEFRILDPVLMQVVSALAKCCEFVMLVGAVTAVMFFVVGELLHGYTGIWVSDGVLVSICVAPGLVLWCWGCVLARGVEGSEPRFPLGCCQSCGYDLAGLDGEVCPECGEGR